MRYEPVIGIEVHVELATRTKMFCRCPNDPFDLGPNKAVCPVCLGLPGALPAINRRAVRLGLRAALALGCEIAGTCRFERKSYGYPDLVKGYQITQYELPLGRGGSVMIYGEGGDSREIALSRVHLEEDTAKLVHGHDADGPPASALDGNRSGVPLLEIVTEPVIHTAEEAESYLRQLRNVLVHNGVSRCRMQRGEMRLEANVSVRPRGTSGMGRRVEVKNQSSFRFVRDAVAYEIERQGSRLERGEAVEQQTRGWDPDRRRTFELRSKEESHDYRYFPEPDLPPVRIEPRWIEIERRAMPEPLERFRETLLADGVPPQDVVAMMDNETVRFLFDVRRHRPEGVRRAARWLVRDVFALLKQAKVRIEESRLSAAQLAEVVHMAEAGRLSAAGARTVIERLFHEGGTAARIVEREDLVQVSDADTVREAVDDVLREREDLVRQFRAGKLPVRQALFGAAMNKMRGRADPRTVGELLDERLRH